MNTHPYLRAYMAGIAIPTAFLLVALTAFCLARFVFQIPILIERALVFPMAIVPNLFGAWNMIYVALRARRQWSIGMHGALLPFVLAPIAYSVPTLLGVLTLTPRGLVYFGALEVPFYYLPIGFPIAVALYYLLWKYSISFLNRLLQIAD